MCSTRLKPVPVYGLLAACAFGMLNKELMLSKLVLKELEAFNQNQEYIQHIALFNSFYQIFQVSSIFSYSCRCLDISSSSLIIVINLEGGIILR